MLILHLFLYVSSRTDGVQKGWNHRMPNHGQLLHYSELSFSLTGGWMAERVFAFTLRAYSRRAFGDDNGSIEWMG